jgi:hypothetical protein
LAASLLGLVRTEPAAAKLLCTPTGKKCNKQSARCKASNCLQAPFSIEAVWTNGDSDHDTHLFVPNAVGSTAPAPFVDQGCNPGHSNCETGVYPFACVNQDAFGPGDEITTIRKLLKGTYEYWMELAPAPAGDLTIILRNKGGKKIRSWTSPANPNATDIGWHVFDIDGNTGSITSINQTMGTYLPAGAHDPSTDVCP